MQNKLSMDELRELAGRLAATTPTQEQKKKHEQLMQQRSLPEGARPNKLVLEQAELADDILQVSRALQPLLRDSAPANKQVAALAMQKWGTEENVTDLITHVEGNDLGAIDMRLEIARALAAIGDERAIPVVTKQVMTNFHDRARGMGSSLVAFGAKAEPELRKYLKSANFQEQQLACDILKEIGTQASIADLEALEQSILVKTHARSAIDAIRGRMKK
jgi:HEAT repeat protein